MTAIVFQVGGGDAFREQVLDGPGVGTRCSGGKQAEK